MIRRAGMRVEMETAYLGFRPNYFLSSGSGQKIPTF